MNARAITNTHVAKVVHVAATHAVANAKICGNYMPSACFAEVEIKIYKTKKKKKQKRIKNNNNFKKAIIADFLSFFVTNFEIRVFIAGND